MINKTIYMMVGLPASGKSTYAKTINNAVVLSSDKMREENGLAEGFTSNEFWQHYVKVANETCGDIVLDATNLIRKNRINMLKNIKHSKAIAIVMATHLSKCLERNFKRERSVPYNVIIKYRNAFTIPLESEGFDEVRIIYDENPYNVKYIEDLIERFGSQYNHHHIHSLAEHSKKVSENVPERMRRIAMLHDCGKPFTARFGDDGEMHFKNHASVGAYELLSCGFDAHDVALVELHMAPFFGNKPRGVDNELWNDVMILHEADIKN